MTSFRNVLQIPCDKISDMREDQLNRLMGQLFLAQAYKCKSAASKVWINAETKARDGGCDGWSEKPGISDEWLGTTKTCWQFKARTAGEPAKLTGEVTKKIPNETLANGGRFVLVASGSTSGKPGEDERLRVLIEEAKKNNLPTENIDVIGSERLANWCNQNPAIAAYYTGLPSGFWTFEKWARSDLHRTPWETSEEIQTKINELRKQLDFFDGEIKHLHIQGLPGIGKTRFALELCRGAEWSNSVVYINQSSEFPMNELIDYATNDEQIRLMIIADETETNQLDILREQIGQGNGRVKLITIGQGKSPDSLLIPCLELKPLDSKVMAKIIKAWYPNMPPENIDFVVRFADGYVRLARLASDAVVMNPSMNLHKLLKRDDVRIFLDKMLGTEKRYPLYVVAVLTSIGWNEDKQLEGETVARHFGLDWGEVRYAIDEFERKYRIVPQSGRYRFISPAPLGIQLASEAWNTIPDKLRTLPEVLPTERAISAYYERRGSITSNPNVRDFAREEINSIKSFQDILSLQTVRRWAASSPANPEVAASNLLKVVKDTKFEERLQISGEVRRLLIHTLGHLAWKPTSFHDSIMALGFLAEAENESWANNATGVFVDCFQIYLGGTAVPFQERLNALDDITKICRPKLIKLVIKALSTIGNQYWKRTIDNPKTDEIPEREWVPNSPEEYLDCISLAIAQLCEIAASGNSEVQDELIASAEKLGSLLRETSLRKTVGEFFEAIKQSYPSTRESLRRIIARIIDHEKNFLKKLTPEELREIEIIHERFEESTFTGRLLQYVGVESWETNQNLEIEPIAKELYQNPNIFAEQWAWLTSGVAGSGWQLGEALGRIDKEGKLADILPSFPNRGRDLRLFAAYLKIRRDEMGDIWFDRWNELQLQNNPESATLLLEIAWRCGITEFSAKKIVEILRTQVISPQLVGGLAYGSWSDNISPSALHEILTAMVDTGHRETAIGIMMYRLQKRPDEIQFWDSLALILVLSPELFTSRNQMTGFFWKEVASKIIHSHAEEIAEAIIRQYGDKKSSEWLFQDRDATIILSSCINEKPIESWNMLKSYLPSAGMYYLASGFPHGLIDCVPAEEILTWVSEMPEERSEILSRILTMNLQDDSSIASIILDTYGDNAQVADSILSGYLPKIWSGPSSVHWDTQANKLEHVAYQTKLPRMKRWASFYSSMLRERAERSSRYEEEETIP